jgi:flagellar biogenesis protein FliO
LPKAGPSGSQVFALIAALIVLLCVVPFFKWLSKRFKG